MRLHVAIVVLGLSPLAVQAAPSWSGGGAADAGYDSNPGNAPAGLRSGGSAFVEAQASLSRSLPLGEAVSLLARASVMAQEYSEVRGLGNAKAQGLLRAFLRPDHSLFAPTFSAWGSAAWWEFDSHLRDSAEYRGGLFLLQQLSSEASARLSATWTRRRSGSAVFDLDQRTFALDLEAPLAPRLRLSLGYQWMTGDSVSTSTPGPSIAGAADAIQPDDAFDGLRVYRLPSRTGVSSLGCNWALSQRWSWDTQLLYADSEADRNGIRYQRWQANSGLLWKFDL